MNEKNPIILMVEDEEDVLKINARMMQRRGYEVLTAINCAEAYKHLEHANPDLLILDIMLPDGDGYEICEVFRKQSDHPIIFLSGKNETGDKIEGLDRGGDYYLTKPYNPDELLAVAKRLLERHFLTKEKEEKLTTITRGNLMLDIQNNKALLKVKDIGLTAKEFALLLLLVQNENKEVSTQQLYESVWGEPAVGDVRTVRVHMTNLRKKIDAENTDEYDIVSVYGKGYMFTTMG